MLDDGLSLTGRTAVVTGAGQGIGFATLHALLDAGMNVVGADVVVDELQRVADARRGRAVSVEVDLASETGPDRLVAEAVDRFGPVDLLVHNAAVIGEETGFVDLTDQQWQDGLTSTCSLLSAPPGPSSRT